MLRSGSLRGYIVRMIEVSPCDVVPGMLIKRWVNGHKMVLVIGRLPSHHSGPHHTHCFLVVLPNGTVNEWWYVDDIEAVKVICSA